MPWSVYGIMFKQWHKTAMPANQVISTHLSTLICSFAQFYSFIYFFLIAKSQAKEITLTRIIPMNACVDYNTSNVHVDYDAEF